MNFDQMLETWRAQDEAPLYGVNRDLLQLLIQHAETDLRLGLRLELWMAYGLSAALVALIVWFFASIDSPRTVGDYVATSIAIGATLLYAGAYWVSRKRQALRERGFGSSLQEEIRRNLSLVDYQLSRHGRWASSLRIVSPTMVATILILWLGKRISAQSFGWSEAGIAFFFVTCSVLLTVWGSRLAEKDLLARKRRLSQLLELLNASE